MPWQKNQSGNPKGRKRLTEKEKRQKEEFKKLLKSSVPEALKILLEIMHDENALNRDRISCARTILERAYGNEPLLISEDEDNLVEIRIVREEKRLDEVNESDGDEWEAVIKEIEQEKTLF